MKIAFIMSVPILSSSNGVKMQALSWKEGLEKLGHQVFLVNTWENNDWRAFDIIHFFGFNNYMCEFCSYLYKINPNIILSPILDPNHSLGKYKLISRWGSRRFWLHNRFYDLKGAMKYIKGVSVRSHYEYFFINKGFNIPTEKIFITPLAYRLVPETTVTIKEDFCFHVSLLADERKNVKRLITASKEFGFNLKLAGKLRNSEEKKWLEDIIENNEKVKYVGFLTDNELISYYKRAKVFALPSLFEGVGLVALEAAIYGCKIVITNHGGPKEYCAGMAKEINPYSVTEIGEAIVKALTESTDDRSLQEYVIKHYSLDKTMKDLEQSYLQIISY